jgi:transcriptional regulator with XRE-family HTH domain
MRCRLGFSDAFAIVLQTHRKAKQLSRQALAEKAGLHQTYTGMIERGKSNPSLDAASAIADALGVPLSRLVAEAEQIREQAEVPNAKNRRSNAVGDGAG